MRRSARRRPPRRPHVVVVYKTSTLVSMRRSQSAALLGRLLRERNPAVARFAGAAHAHMRTLAAVARAIRDVGGTAIFIARRKLARRAQIAGADLVMTVGGDGTLLWTSHFVEDEPVLGVNSDPLDSIGFFAGSTARNIGRLLPAALEGKLPESRLARMRVVVGHRRLPVRILNEALFCHENPAATSRYILEVRGRREEHRSSGVWIGPPAGSTAAIRSAGGRVLPFRSRRLQFVVREPYSPRGPRRRLLRGTLRPGERLEIRSKMRAARLYLDGPHLGFSVRLGQRVTFELDSRPLRILALRRR